MLKKSNRKNKKARFLIWMVSLFTLAFLAVYFFSFYLNAYMFLNIFPSLFAATKSETPFYGENIDMSQILPASQHYVVNSKNQDLIDIAANLGVNLIRITNGQKSFGSQTISLYTKDQWNQVLSKMQRKGIKALVQIETAGSNEDYYSLDIRPSYLHLVQMYIDSGVFSHPDVYGVDIRNEPLLTDDNLKMLQTAHAMIKKSYPHLKQTVGWWATPKSLQNPYNLNNYNWSDYSAGQKLASIVDFYSVHMYGLGIEHVGVGLNPDLGTKVFLSRVENGLQTKKPILIEEFGEANGDAVSDQDTIGNSRLQANVYQGVYQALKEIHGSQLLGSVAFDFHSRNHYPDAWAIVKNNGNYLFPAAYILQEYALGKNNPSLQDSTIVTSQSYLAKNADNHGVKNLHISDRIGVKLQLASSMNYSTSLSAPGLLRSVVSLHYDPVSGTYQAIYQASSKGSVQLKILSNSAHSTDNTYTSKVYTLMINIQ